MNDKFKSIIEDVATELSVEPSLIEKDYYATHLLALISEIKFEEAALVFSGGTCLSKVYAATKRMSEDIDLKLVMSPSLLKKSGNQRKKARKKMRSVVQSAIEKSNELKVGEIKVSNNGSYTKIIVEYASKFTSSDSLRDYLQLEITESRLFEGANNKKASSIVSHYTDSAPEIVQIPCVGIQSIVAEKVISMLRRTAMSIRDEARKDDPSLVRHIYDLHIVSQSQQNLDNVLGMLKTLINIDGVQFKEQHPEFLQDPLEEMRMALKDLEGNPLHKERYARFLGPLVYNQDAPDWEVAFKGFKALAERLIGGIEMGVAAPAKTSEEENMISDFCAESFKNVKPRKRGVSTPGFKAEDPTP